MNAEWEQWDVQEKTAQANKRRIEGLQPKADPKEKELNDDLNRVKRWAAKKLAIAEEIEFEDTEDALFNKGYMAALEDMIMEIEMRES